MSDVAGRLHKELYDVAKPYLDQIQELEHRSENKKNLISSLAQEVKEKEREMEAFEAEAGEALGRGEDPRPLLSQISSLKSDLEDLKKILASAGQPSKAEQDRIQELRQEMSGKIHERIEKTKTFQEQSQAMLDSMRSAVKAKNDWQDGLEKFCAELGVDVRRHWLLSLADSSEGYQLGRKISAYCQKHAQVFSR